MNTGLRLTVAVMTLLAFYLTDVYAGPKHGDRRKVYKDKRGLTSTALKKDSAGCKSYGSLILTLHSNLSKKGSVPRALALLSLPTTRLKVEKRTARK